MEFIERLLCKRYAALLVPYSENSLPAAKRKQVDAHLAVCPACREEVEGLRAMASLLTTFTPPVPEPAADLWMRVQAQITVEAAPRPARARRVPAYAFSLAGVAAMAAVCAFGYVGWKATIATAPVASVAPAASTVSAAGNNAERAKANVAMDSTARASGAAKTPSKATEQASASFVSKTPAGKAKASVGRVVGVRKPVQVATVTKPVADPFVPLENRTTRMQDSRSRKQHKMGMLASKKSGAGKGRQPLGFREGDVAMAEVPPSISSALRGEVKVATVPSKEFEDGTRLNLDPTFDREAPMPSVSLMATESGSVVSGEKRGETTAVTGRPVPAASPSVVEAVSQVRRQRGLFTY